MPVPTYINDLSATAASNSPLGSDAILATLDDYLRGHAALIATPYTLLSSVAGTDTITATAVNISGYAAGLTFRFVSAGANTGAVTINLNSLGAKSITKSGTTALAAGDIAASAVVQITYDGTQFQLVSGAGGATGTSSDIDGGSAASTYLTAQNYNGGTA